MKKANYHAVLDTSAIIALFTKQGEYVKVQEHILNATSKSKIIALSSVNWGETYYITYRKFGKNRAENIMSELEQLPIHVMHTTDEIVKTAADFKVAFPSLSFPDCFGVSIAALLKKPIITSDADFLAVKNEIEVAFFKA